MTRDDTIGAHSYARPASDALLRRMHRDVAVPFVHRPGRTSFDARSIFTLIAERGKELESYIWKLPDSTHLSARPNNASLQVVLTLAGNNTPTASGTAMEVYYHRQPFALRWGFRRRILGR